MEFLKNWIMGISGATVLISLICTLVPKTSTARLVRVCGTIILLLSVIAPLKTIRSEELKFNSHTDWKEIESVVREENERFEILIIEDRLGEYVLQRAKQLGVECEVNVRVGETENGVLFPQAIEIAGTGEMGELCCIVESECGIKPTVVKQEVRRT